MQVCWQLQGRSEQTHQDCPRRILLDLQPVRLPVPASVCHEQAQRKHAFCHCLDQLQVVEQQRCKFC